MPYTNRQLDEMREFLKHEKEYALIRFKGIYVNQLKEKGKTHEEIMSALEKIGTDLDLLKVLVERNEK